MPHNRKHEGWVRAGPPDEEDSAGGRADLSEQALGEACGRKPESGSGRGGNSTGEEHTVGKLVT